MRQLKVLEEVYEDDSLAKTFLVHEDFVLEFKEGFVKFAKALQLRLNKQVIHLAVMALVALLAHLLVLWLQLLTLEELVNVVVKHCLLLPEDFGVNHFPFQLVPDFDDLLVV